MIWIVRTRNYLFKLNTARLADRCKLIELDGDVMTVVTPGVIWLNW